MELIYADKTSKEIGYLKDYQLDLEIGTEHDFELIVPRALDIRPGYKIYEYGNEYGGIIGSITTDTTSEDITLTGYTWRGMLNKRVIRPTTGQDYRIVSGSVVDIINGMLSEYSLSSLYLCDDCDVAIAAYQFKRYCTLLDGITDMLKTLNKRLEIHFEDDMMVHLGIVDIVDYSEQLEFSDDYNLQVIIRENKAVVNHLICLGGGELKEREVIDLYMDVDGTVSQMQTQFGVDEIVEAYDYGSSEDLLTDGTNKLKEQVGQSAELKIQDVDVELYDIVGARDYRNGTYIKREIVQKIIRVESGIQTIEYEVGE